MLRLPLSAIPLKHSQPETSPCRSIGPTRRPSKKAGQLTQRGLSSGRTWPDHSIKAVRWCQCLGENVSAQSRNVLFPQSRNVLTNAIAEGPFPSYQKRGSERRGAVKGARLLRGEREPLTASTVLDNEYRGKGGFPPSASTSTKQDISTLLRHAWATCLGGIGR